MEEAVSDQLLTITHQMTIMRKLRIMAGEKALTQYYPNVSLTTRAFMVLEEISHGCKAKIKLVLRQ